ncbi:MAG: SDR family NAD(P)-dependent oxidoreductase [Proteobacteria bacterium]|nr:SDR family NAD(P)-dependent oxidoreductase [Pseudomonadota bacterium]
MQWGIIGLGWLGSALAERLKILGHESWGTHRSSFEMTQHDLPTHPHDVLFLNTPPLMTLAPKTFARKAFQTSAPKVIFISSTSVFGSGQDSVDETTPPAPDTPSGRWLLETEGALRSLFGSRLLVIRPGGLIGGERHPARHLSGRKGLSGGCDRVNLIHREDLLSLILAAPSELSLLHAVSSHHPTRADYYTQWSQKLGLAAPEFIDEETSKRVVNSRHAEALIKWRCRELDWL